MRKGKPPSGENTSSDIGTYQGKPFKGYCYSWPISFFFLKKSRGNQNARVLRTHITDGDASEQGHLEHSLKFHRVSETPKTPFSIGIPPRKVTWQWKIATLNRGYIFKWMCFHCHVGFQWGIHLQQVQTITPPKTSMEPKNHPIEKKTIFQLVIFRDKLYQAALRGQCYHDRSPFHMYQLHISIAKLRLLRGGETHQTEHGWCIDIR